MTHFKDLKVKRWSFLRPLHEGVWGSRSRTPFILNLDTSWRWVVNFTPWSLDSMRKKP